MTEQTSRANHAPRTYPQREPKPEREPVIVLQERPAGNWTITINGGTEFPATLAEVVLWKRILELEAGLKEWML